MGSDDPNLIPGYIYFTQMTTSPEIPGADRFLQGCAKLFGPRSVGRPGEPLLFSILRLEGRDERVQTSGPGGMGLQMGRNVPLAPGGCLVLEPANPRESPLFFFGDTGAGGWIIAQHGW